MFPHNLVFLTSYYFYYLITCIILFCTCMLLVTDDGLHLHAKLFAAALCDLQTIATKKMDEETLPVPTSHPKLVLSLHFDIGDGASYVANVEVNNTV